MQQELENQDKDLFLKQFKFNPNMEIKEPKKSLISHLSVSPASLIVGIFIFLSLNTLSNAYKNIVLVDKGIVIQQQLVQQDMTQLLNSFNDQFYTNVFQLNKENIKNNIANPYFSANGLVKWNQMLANTGMQDLIINNHDIQSSAIPYAPPIITGTRIDPLNGQEFIVKVPMNITYKFNDKNISINAETTMKMIKNKNESSPNKFLIEDIVIDQSFK